MKRLLSAILLSSLAVAAEAQSTPPPLFVFTAVDAVRREPGRLFVTGLLEGETAPREVGLSFQTFGSSPPDVYISQLEGCERLALLAMTKPGQYRLRAQHEPNFWSYAICTLERVAR